MSDSHGCPRRFGAGKVLISLVAVETAVGPYLADWNETHIHNPTWPPHAKFHNGQTMSMGASLAAMTLWQLWRAHGSPAAARQALDSASLAASMYWLTATSALAYPGAKAVDPPGTATFPQWKFVLPSLLLVAAGYTLERRRLGNRRTRGSNHAGRAGTPVCARTPVTGANGSTASAPGNGRRH